MAWFFVVKLLANRLLNFDKSSWFILLMLCSTIFIFLVGWSFARKRFPPCLRADELDELTLEVDFMLLVFEFLEDPDLTDALEEF